MKIALTIFLKWYNIQCTFLFFFSLTKKKQNKTKNSMINLITILFFTIFRHSLPRKKPDNELEKGECVLSRQEQQKIDWLHPNKDAHIKQYKQYTSPSLWIFLMNREFSKILTLKEYKLSVNIIGIILELSKLVN